MIVAIVAEINIFYEQFVYDCQIERLASSGLLDLVCFLHKTAELLAILTGIV